MQTDEVVLATVSMKAEHDKAKNIEAMLKFIDEAKQKDVDFIVFPETSLQGYLWGTEGSFPGSKSPEELYYHYETAETVPGETTRLLAEKARETDMYVQWGMTEKGEGVLFNSTALAGPDGYIGKFRKVHLALSERFMWRRGEAFPVYNTKIGRIGMLICGDAFFPESCRELALAAADILSFSTAWPISLPSFEAGKEKNDYLGYIFDIITKIRAVENNRWFLASNLVGKPPHSKLTFYGHSRIVSPAGIVLVDTGPKEGLVYVKVNVQKGILETMIENWSGMNLYIGREPSSYKLISRSDLY